MPIRATLFSFITLPEPQIIEAESLAEAIMAVADADVIYTSATFSNGEKTLAYSYREPGEDWHVEVIGEKEPKFRSFDEDCVRYVFPF